jgi:hypothetical protein
MQLTLRHFVALLIVVVAQISALYLVKDVAPIVGIVGGILAVLYASYGAEGGLSGEVLVEAVRRASRGDVPPTPQGAPASALKIYEELSRVAESIRLHEEREKQTAADTREAMQALDDLLKKLGDGVTTQRDRSRT